MHKLLILIEKQTNKQKTTKQTNQNKNKTNVTIDYLYCQNGQNYFNDISILYLTSKNNYPFYEICNMLECITIFHPSFWWMIELAYQYAQSVWELCHLLHYVVQVPSLEH